MTTTTPAHVLRMINERQKLLEKIELLEAFTGGDMFLSLTLLQQRLLEAQLSAMKSYDTILVIRIEVEQRT